MVQYGAVHERHTVCVEQCVAACCSMFQCGAVWHSKVHVVTAHEGHILCVYVCVCV